MSNIDKGRYVYGLLKEGLSASALRSKVSSNNIANVNTKNFKASHVTFEDNLNSSMESLNLKLTNNKHMDTENSDSNIQVVQDKNVAMNQDGNSVDIDSEMAEQAANTLNYLAMITGLNNRIAMKNIVIRDGR